MRWVVLALVAAACGGVQVPQHNGYKSDKAKPWKKPKVLKLDDKGEAKDDGDLSYPDQRRAKWFAIETPSYGSLDLVLEAMPPGDSTNEDFDLAIELLDSGFRSLMLADSEAEGAHEFPKKKTIVELQPGKYYVHLYLEARLDTADYSLKVTFKPTAPAEQKSDFPAQVAMLPPLPLVPIADDTPAKYRPPPQQQTVVSHVVRPDKPKKDPAPPPATTLTGRVIGVSVVSGGTQILIARGTANGAAAKMHGQLRGIPGSFDVACSERSCVAQVSATPDQIKSAGDVVLTP
jgi:hypothetical protein